ncbi:MAG: hypothetical protein HY858_05490 [Candidatus Solibacter usitatus]|nr:hypothetical protein [Candidatus Solibacter usitatus]
MTSLFLRYIQRGTFRCRIPLLIFQWALLLSWSVSLAAAEPSLPPLVLGISSPSVPAGAIAQIRLTLPESHRISSGKLSLDFDPAVFGSATSVDVLCATGDQFGVANVEDRRVEIQFGSPTGGIGQLPSAPLITVTIPVLPGIANGTVGFIKLTAGPDPWRDAYGYRYLVTAPPGQLKVGGTLSIDSVTPVGGPLPAGATVRIAGGGFTASTRVEIEGVALSAVTLVGPQAIDVVLGASADLRSKRVTARIPNGAETDFFPPLRWTSYGGESWSRTIQPIFPQQTYAGAFFGYLSDWTYGAYALYNQTSQSVLVEQRTTEYINYKFGYGYGRSVFTIPAGGVFLRSARGSQLSSTSLTPLTPIRMIWLGIVPGDRTGRGVSASQVSSTSGAGRQAYVTWDGGQPTCDVKPSGPIGGYDTPCLAWLVDSPPATRTLTVRAFGIVPFRATAATANGGNWLTISPQEGATCTPTSSTPCPDSSRITLTMDPSSLEPGQYTGEVTITPNDPVLLPSTFSFIFRVTRSIISLEGPYPLYFPTDPAGTPPPSLRLQIISDGEPAPFSVSLRGYGGAPMNWLSITPMEGVTPATLTLTADPAALPAQAYSLSGSITVSGPANSVERNTAMYRRPPQVLYTSARDTPVTFWAKAGAAQPAARLVSVSPYFPDDIKVATANGGSWLASSSTYDQASGGTRLAIAVNQTGLDAGTYRGTITVASTGHSEYAPAQIAVILAVWAEQPPISVAPESMEFWVASGSATGSYSVAEIEAKSLAVTSIGIPVESSAATSTMDGTNWLSVLPPRDYVPYGGVYLKADARNLPPGEYHGTVQLTAPPGLGHFRDCSCHFARHLSQYPSARVQPASGGFRGQRRIDEVRSNRPRGDRHHSRLEHRTLQADRSLDRRRR